MAEDRRHREQERELVPDAESVGQFGETPEQALIKRSSHVSPPARCALTSTTSSCLWVPNSLGEMGAPLCAVLAATYCSRQSLVATAFLTVTASAIVRVYPRAATERVAAATAGDGSHLDAIPMSTSSRARLAWPTQCRPGLPGPRQLCHRAKAARRPRVLAAASASPVHLGEAGLPRHEHVQLALESNE
jgi:hypothetical protein